MSPDDGIKKMNEVIETLEQGMERISQEMALNTIGMVIRRIQIEEGIKGRMYSTNPLPLYYFYGRALNSRGEALLQKYTKKEMRKQITKRGGTVKKNSRLDK